MTDHNLSPIEAARTLRMRIEQQLGAYSRMSKNAPTDNVHAGLPAEPTRVLLLGVEDLFDRVELVERRQRRMLDRLDFLVHIGRMLGHEDWSDLSIDDRTPAEAGLSRPGALVTAAQASVPGASGPASSLNPPGELAGTRPPQ